MSDVTRILSRTLKTAILKPPLFCFRWVYDQLRKLASRELKGGATGNTLQTNGLGP